MGSSMVDVKHGGWNQRRVNGAILPNAGQTNFTGQQTGSNSSAKKVLLFIFNGGIYRWGKNTAIERLPWFSPTPNHD